MQSRFVRRAIRRRLRRGMLVDLKRQRHRKRRAFAEHAFHRDGAVHLLDELLHDRHAEARALILRAGALLFLCKRLKKLVVHKIFAHTDARITYCKAECRRVFVTGNLLRIRFNRAVFFIVFCRVAEQIQ